MVATGRAGTGSRYAQRAMTVDIMLPFYGDVALMRKAVSSVLAQNDRDWRLTVVDDGYPDPSIASWFRDLHDPRVRYLRNAQRLGAQANNRLCLGYVEHELFVMMGADDVMLPHYLEVVRGLHERVPEAAVVQPGVQVIDEDDRPVRTLADSVKKWYAPRGTGCRVVRGESLATSLLRGNWLYNPSLCWRTAVLERVRVRESADVFDLALPLDVIAAGEPMVVDDAVCFQYRRHRSSDSGSAALLGNRFPEEHRFFVRTAEEMSARGWHAAARAARCHVSSRLNAACQLPRAVRRGDSATLRVLGRHILGH